ncbi:iron-containing alcohol dehydrogenase [Amycolatopsis sp. PS_44_ISF1]|uniref:iron-containing alcohol dehydrogenase n=1 Tax=Amycolatopsis sp. PS_44_ISF1 TaxID=2974917 RepID=UPI0028DFBF7E|nr:iron-containing alcohol dehydrogenase [Amycolatopsis sp. PS_44_ISF1]MDT8910060.1 iron-containing alcohol dehydrogenase [Amycolatopsis sp. PS_44_ISF1]
MRLDLQVPTAVHFGRGRLAELGTRTAPLGRNALVVCGRNSARRNGFLDVALSTLDHAGVRATVFDQVSADPKSSEVDAAAARAEAAGCTVIVGLGGGSAIDAAKAVAVGLRHGPSGPLVGRTLEPSGDPVPVVAVPTTAGSGAEVTRGAIITDTARALKAGIRGDDLFPRIALIDPDLLRTLPPAVAAESGFDALAHAIEGYVARKASPITRLYCEQALGILGESLPSLVAGNHSEPVLDAMALAALYGGFSVANASTCLPHRVQQAMGSVSRLHISHGRGLAAVYPAWLSHAHPHAAPALDRIGTLLGDTDVDAALTRLMTAVGVRAGLLEHGFTEDDLTTIANSVVGNIDNDPIPDAGHALVQTILAQSLK